MQDRTAMHRRALQIVLALLTVFIVTTLSAPQRIDAPSLDRAHAVETLMVGASSAPLGDRTCPCPEDQTQQTCGKGACPAALVLGASQLAIARQSAPYEVVQDRHKTSTPKPEPEPPRPFV